MNEKDYEELPDSDNEIPNYLEGFDYDEELAYTCLVCGKRISTGFYYCNKCAIEFSMADEKGHFKRPKLWPDWARDLYNYDRRRRRRIEKERAYEITFFAEEEWENNYVEFRQDFEKLLEDYYVEKEENDFIEFLENYCTDEQAENFEEL